MKQQTRICAKALVIKDGHVLLSKERGKQGEVLYFMPGGGLEAGELLPETVRRECLEECGLEVNPTALAFVVEGKWHGVHRIDFVFSCDYVRETGDLGTKWDKCQIGFEWVDIENIANEPLYPRKLRSATLNYHNNKAAEVYLGSENEDE